MSASPEPSRLALEVRFDTEPIEGRLYEDGGRLDRRFSGWLGLIAAIEAASGGEQPGPPEPEGEGR